MPKNINSTYLIDNRLGINNLFVLIKCGVGSKSRETFPLHLAPFLPSCRPHIMPPSPTIPFAAASLGIAIFSMMDVLMKHLSIEIGAYNAMFWRVMAGALFGGMLFFARREPLPARSTMRLHILRGTIAAAMTFLFFWGIARVPLAEGIALSFIAPLITLYLAAVMLGEQISRNAILASVLAFIGVLIILSGRISGDHRPDAMWGIIAIFGSAVLYAYNLILQRQQSQIASPVEIAFFQNLVCLAVLGLFAPFLAVVPIATHIPAIAGAALLAMAAIILASWAYARAEAQILVTVEYTAFIWAALFGWLAFDEAVTIETIVGALLIVCGCLIASQARPEVTAL